MPARRWRARPSSCARTRPASRRSSAAGRSAACPLYPWLIPLQPAAAPDVGVGDEHRDDERDHLHQAEDPELVEVDGPRIQEDDLDVEDDEQHGREVVLDGEPAALGLPGGLDPALI